MKKKYIAWFNEISKDDVALVGGKGANLGEMWNAKIPVPFGFVVTSAAYQAFLDDTGIERKIRDVLKLLNHKDPKNLSQVASKIQKIISAAHMPRDIAREIMTSYADLSRKSKGESIRSKLFTSLQNPYVAVRSSATAEDLPNASFAGQQATFLNVSGEANVVKKVQEAWASLFTPRAIFYREEQHFDHMKVGIAVPVQLMVSSQVSGVMFTIDPISNDKNCIVIEAILGLGELIVQGEVTPDHFEVEKKKLQLLNKKISPQGKAMMQVNGKNKIIAVKEKDGQRQKISDADVLKVAKIGKLLEKHYFFPQDIEWALEGGEIYIVQTRPITTIKKSAKKPSENETKITLPVLISGDPASPGITWGPAKVIYHASQIDRVKEGDVLVTEQTNPDFVPAMKRAVAIVTERGGRTSHAAIVSRELGIPAVVGALKATKLIPTGTVVTVHGTKGTVYKGALTQAEKNKILASTASTRGSTLKTATKVYVNLATPTRVEEVAKMNVDGIGLLRAEFMIADIGTHPKKLIKEHKEGIFINKLAGDLVKFCKAFHPRPVVYRATDFKTNEYRNLIGGKEFEPEEPNPMLGYRGAYRYIADPKVFELELEAIKKVRNKYGLRNLWLMLPFVRTVEDLINVKKIIAANGLSRSSSFKLWMMVEIPSNVILLDKFCEAGIDGVSIGSNDLTMLILGTDRDNTEVAPEFNEQNPAVLWAIERVIKTCLKYGVTSSICGQAPSDYPELVEKLVSWGVTSMSVNSDAVNRVRETISDVESKLVRKRKN
ncbi:phosphoenolpyruvate synthase [Candidatus Gottesmanbacteria bacterium]|nr:phosphoenolpyruvate synthase [Candidatus Gottesmanbacteria bacterium]